MTERRSKICDFSYTFIFFHLMINHIFGQTLLQAVWMVPFTSHPTSSFFYNASSSVSALALGLQTVYNQSILPGYVFNITVIDTECSSKQSMGALVDLLLERNVDVVFGPPCSKVVQPVGELLAYRDVPLLNWVSLGQPIDYKTEHNTYIRTMAPISSLGGIMTLFYYYTGWRRLVMISSEGDDYKSAAGVIETNLKEHAANYFLLAHHYSDVNINASAKEIDQILSNIIYEGRIIILVIPRNELRTYMLQAHFLGLTSGDYQFLFTDTRLAGNADMAFINSDQLWKRGDQYDTAARQAHENVLYFVLGHDSHDVTEWKTESFDAYNNIFNGRSDIPDPSEPDEFAAYLHDTVILYAKTLNRTLTYGFTGSGRAIIAWSSLEFFKGLSGDVVMNTLGDRQPTFFVYDMDSSGSFHQVASLQYTIDENLAKVNATSTFTTIIWGDGSTTDDPYIPPDTPPCGFFNENCPPSDSPSENILIIIIPVCLTMLVILLALFLVFRWWRSESNFRNMSWKIDYNNLNFNLTSKKIHSSMRASKGLNSSTGSLDSTSLSGTIRSGATSAATSRHSLNRGQIFTTVAMLKGEMVAVKISTKKKIHTDRKFLLQMKRLFELKHANVTTFVGVCTVPEKICSVWEYCSKGSIQDVIENDDINLDTMFKLSLALDICQGLDYLHKSSVRFHGNLRSSNCVIDNRWVCKLTDFGTQRLKPADESVDTFGEHAFYARLFWTAPEILRKLLKKEHVSGTSEADIYALGVIIKELLCRNEPYCAESHLSPKEIITKVAEPENSDEVFRPVISDTELDSDYSQSNMIYLIQRCWAEDPEIRPKTKNIIRTLNKLNPYKKASVVDNMIAMMEKYTNNLEDIVAERTEQLQEEKVKTDALLYRMLPRKVAEDLKVGRSVQAEAFDSVTIYFSDIVQFTNLAGESTPLEIVALLNALYTLFDAIISHYNVYKVETIGDAYMIVSGLPERNGTLHVKEIAGVALSILQSVLTFEIPHKPDRQLEIRIGLHTGSVVAGVVGLTMPRYCLFGDTVNTASRMESNGKPLKIHISPSTKEALDEFPEFLVEERGEIPIKGKGLMRTYWLSGLYSENEEICIESDQYLKLIEPDKHLNDSPTDEDNGGGANNLAADELKVCDNFQGKVSVADSGISMDKGVDDKFGNVFLNTDTTSGEDIEADCAVQSSGANLKQTGNDIINTGGVSRFNDGEINNGDSNRTLGKFSLTEFFCETFNRNAYVDENNSDPKLTDDNQQSAQKLEIINDSSSLSSSDDFETFGATHTNSKSINTRNADANEMEENRLLRLRERHTNYKTSKGLQTISVEDDGSENDTASEKNVKKTQKFRPPARTSATDFMAVHNNWFQD
ncbi:atrial natriuretic peptide receptor 1-like [Ruditapes philippinarum]|uniref:atrial natriuretic peptide receptor 1-like n=1 Tax=Ruditapes philippinarum TaxID=129788 RepID=UPI00295C02DE|nr:atrial natriuretic peptide receptor 1-like [Ruditapes philippinarum]